MPVIIYLPRHSNFLRFGILVMGIVKLDCMANKILSGCSAGCFLY